MVHPIRLAVLCCLMTSLISPHTAQSAMMPTDRNKGSMLIAPPPESQTARVRPAEPELYALWNGFLDQVNVLELSNTEGYPIAVRLELYRMDGSPGTSVLVPIPENDQRDIVVNDLPGFSRNSYGTIRLTCLSGFNGDEEDASQLYNEEFYRYTSLSNVIDARMSFYRNGTANSSHEFAFSIPLVRKDSLLTTSAVTFNTFRPGAGTKGAASVVANWLTIVNLRPKTQSYAVDTYSIDGLLLKTRIIEIPAFGRQDLEAGHENPGPSQVGLHTIRPLDIKEPSTAEEENEFLKQGHLVQLTRYGYREDGSIAFAFPLQAVSPQNNYSSLTGTDDVIVPLSTMLSAQNWLELANTEDVRSKLQLEIFDAAGSRKHLQEVLLNPRAQQHINVNEFLGNAMTGHAVLSKMTRIENDNSLGYEAVVIAQSMHYFRNAEGGIDSIYGAEALPLSQSYRTRSGSYNLFLGMNNWVKIFNREKYPAEFHVAVFRSGAKFPMHHPVTVPANGSIDVPVHNSQIFFTQANTYGVVQVIPTGWLTESGKGFFGDFEPFAYSAQLLRVRMADANTVDFVAPISVSYGEGEEF